MRQDYLFLIDYARLLALGAARAPDLETMRRFADLTQAILGEEMELHRAFAAEFGITPGQLEAEARAPKTRGLHRLPRPHGGDRRLRRAGRRAAAVHVGLRGDRAAPRAGAAAGRRALRALDRHYADPEFGALAEWCRELVDRLAEEAGEAGRERMRRAFQTCSRYELAFWDTAR